MIDIEMARSKVMEWLKHNPEAWFVRDEGIEEYEWGWIFPWSFVDPNVATAKFPFPMLVDRKTGRVVPGSTAGIRMDIARLLRLRGED